MMKLIVVLLFTLIRSSDLAPRRCQLDLINPTHAEYSRLISSIRNEVVDPTLRYGGTSLPVMAAPSHQYFRVDLVISTGMVSLVVLKDDLYIMGYMAMDQLGVNRVRYFSKAAPAILQPLFPEVLSKNYQQIRGYTESYGSLEKKAKTDRKSLGLGVNKLKSFAERIHKKAQEDVLEAKFLLLSVQMISEATRFKYIENLVLSFFPDWFSPEGKVLVLENNWGTISKAVKKSCRGNFGKTITLKSLDFRDPPWSVKDVKELEVGLLKYCPDEENEDVNQEMRDPLNSDRVDVDSSTLENPSRREHGASEGDTCPSGLQNIISGSDGRNYDGHSRCLAVQEADSRSTTDLVEVPISPKVMLVTLLVAALVTRVMMSFLSYQGNVSSPRRPGERKTSPSGEKA